MNINDCCEATARSKQSIHKITENFIDKNSLHWISPINSHLINMAFAAAAAVATVAAFGIAIHSLIFAQGYQNTA